MLRHVHPQGGERSVDSPSTASGLKSSTGDDKLYADFQRRFKKAECMRYLDLVVSSRRDGE
jgi:hypothetical protein